MKFKILLPVFIIIFIAIILLFAKNANIDNSVFSKDPSIPKTINEDSILKADSIKRLYLLGQFEPSKDSTFVLVKSPYTTASGMYLRKSVFEKFKIMYDSAKKAGISLFIISATRNFETQKGIWEGKWTGGTLYYGKNLAKEYPDPVNRSNYILKYSSMPGTSRHHWGTDFDLNSVQLSYFNAAEGKKVYSWLHENANKYGFCQPYTKDSLRTGYQEEKWHWSYVPESSENLREYLRLVTYSDIKGFKGCETAEKNAVIENYVKGISKSCQ